MKRTMLTVAVALLGACAAGRAPVRVTQPGMTCAEATRVARTALLRMGYRVDHVERAKADRPGYVLARRETGWIPRAPEADSVFEVRADIACTAAGAEIAATSSEPLARRMTFRDGFVRAVQDAIERGRFAAAKRSREVTGPGLHVDVKPLRSPESLAELGADLPALHLTPVRLTIRNRTERAYLFRAGAVELVAEGGRRERRLSAVAAARLAGDTALESLAGKLLSDAPIAPNGELSGFLLFPAAAYRRASVTFVDEETEENEGVAIEF